MAHTEETHCCTVLTAFPGFPIPISSLIHTKLPPLFTQWWAVNTKWQTEWRLSSCTALLSACQNSRDTTPTCSWGRVKPVAYLRGHFWDVIGCFRDAPDTPMSTGFCCVVLQAATAQECEDIVSRVGEWGETRVSRSISAVAATKVSLYLPCFCGLLCATVQW